jgi:hypothetical protein
MATEQIVNISTTARNTAGGVQTTTTVFQTVSMGNKMRTTC